MGQDHNLKQFTPAECPKYQDAKLGQKKSSAIPRLLTTKLTEPWIRKAFGPPSLGLALQRSMSQGPLCPAAPVMNDTTDITDYRWKANRIVLYPDPLAGRIPFEPESYRKCAPSGTVKESLTICDRGTTIIALSTGCEGQSPTYIHIILYIRNWCIIKCVYRYMYIWREIESNLIQDLGLPLRSLYAFGRAYVRPVNQSTSVHHQKSPRVIRSAELGGSRGAPEHIHWIGLKEPTQLHVTLGSYFFIIRLPRVGGVIGTLTEVLPTPSLNLFPPKQLNQRS